MKNIKMITTCCWVAIFIFLLSACQKEETVEPFKEYRSQWVGTYHITNSYDGNVKVSIPSGYDSLLLIRDNCNFVNRYVQVLPDGTFEYKGAESAGDRMTVKGYFYASDSLFVRYSKNFEQIQGYYYGVKE